MSSRGDPVKLLICDIRVPFFVKFHKIVKHMATRKKPRGTPLVFHDLGMIEIECAVYFMVIDDTHPLQEGIH